LVRVFLEAQESPSTSQESSPKGCEMSSTVLSRIMFSTFVLFVKQSGASPGVEVVQSWSKQAVGGSLRGTVTAASKTPFGKIDLSDLPYIFYWAPQIVAMGMRVHAASDEPDDATIWTEAKYLIRNATYASSPGKHFMDLCAAGQLANYTTDACAPNQIGSMLVSGVPLDAYFCGSNSSGIDWNRTYWAGKTSPVMNICGAEAGSAYGPQGICGRWSTKQLIVAFYQTVPNWHLDVELLNVPSLHCLLDLGNCDIAYCQGCAGRCSPAV